MPFDRMNPYQKSLAGALGELGVEVEFEPIGWHVLTQMRSMDALHIHWTTKLDDTPLPKFVVRLPWLAMQLVLLRLTGRRIVWTVHNLENHERRNRLQDRLSSLVIGHLANAVIVHCRTAGKWVQTRFGIPDSKVFSIPHGNYISAYPNTISRPAARHQLGFREQNRVLLFLGHIRPYKGVEDLIQAFEKIKDRDAVLVIAGKTIETSCEESIRFLARSDARIQFCPGFVEAERVQVYMQAADVVVFPYRDVLTSGAILLAMSFGKACIAPRLGCIPEYLDDAGGILYEPEDRNGLSAALMQAWNSFERLADMGEHNRQRAEEYSWQRHAASMLTIY